MEERCESTRCRHQCSGIKGHEVGQTMHFHMLSHFEVLTWFDDLDIEFATPWDHIRPRPEVYGQGEGKPVA